MTGRWVGRQAGKVQIVRVLVSGYGYGYGYIFRWS